MCLRPQSEGATAPSGGLPGHFHQTAACYFSQLNQLITERGKGGDREGERERLSRHSCQAGRPGNTCAKTRPRRDPPPQPSMREASASRPIRRPPCFHNTACVRQHRRPPKIIPFDSLDVKSQSLVAVTSEGGGCRWVGGGLERRQSLFPIQMLPSNYINDVVRCVLRVVCLAGSQGPAGRP